MKKYLNPAIAISVILAIAIALDVWVVGEKTALNLYCWAGFLIYMIVGSFFTGFKNNTSPQSRRINQRFLTFCSVIVATIFLAFSASFLDIFDGTWLTTVRWSLIVISLLIYAVVGIEISESPENTARRRASKIEWRYVINNTLFAAVVLSLILQGVLHGFSMQDPLINYYLTGFIIFMALAHLLVWYPNSRRVRIAFLSILSVITLALIGVFVISLTPFKESIQFLGEPKTVAILSGISGFIMLITVGYKILQEIEEKQTEKSTKPPVPKNTEQSDEEPRMKVSDSVEIKLIITGLLAIVIYKISPHISYETSLWLYSMVGLLAYLMFGFFFDRLKSKNAERFLAASFSFGGILFLVFIISWFEVFTGPLGYLCRWPFFVCSLIITIVNLLGFFATTFNNLEKEYERLADDY